MEPVDSEMEVVNEKIQMIKTDNGSYLSESDRLDYKKDKKKKKKDKKDKKKRNKSKKKKKKKDNEPLSDSQLEDIDVYEDGKIPPAPK